MRQFEKSTFIHCSTQELFDFHTNIDNLPLITPKDTKVTLLRSSKIKEESILEIEAKKNFLTTRWKIKIAKLQHPNLLVDIAIKSPFAYWEHQHIFNEKDDFSELKDVVIFKMPFGFLGALLENWVYKNLEKMFTFRHEMTKKVLERL